MLKNWKVWQKLAAIAVVMGLMIPVLLYLAVSSRNSDIAFARQEAFGVQYLRALGPVYAKLPEHRGRMNALLSGDASQRAPLTALAVELESAFEALSVADRQLGSALQTTESFNALRQGWSEIKGGEQRLSAARSFELHTALIARAAALIEDVGDSSNIRLDPIRDTYYLGEIVLIWGPKAIEDRGQLRGRSAGIVASGRVGPEEQGVLSLLVNNVGSSTAPIDRALKIIIEDNPSYAARLNPLVARSADSTRGFVQLVQNRVLRAAPTPTTGNAELFQAGNAAVDSQVAINNELLTLLDAELTERISSLSRARNIILGASILSILFAAFMVSLLSGTITRQIAAIGELFQKFGAGDAKARAAVYSNDELGATAKSINSVLDNTVALLQTRDERDRIQGNIMKLLDEISGLAEGDLTREAEVTADITGAMADAFNTVTAQLRRVITDVQDTTLQVSSASAEIQTTTEHLAGGSEQQSMQIVDTSAAVDEIALSIQQVSENAAQAALVSEQALANSRQGATAVARTVDGMNAIRQQVQESAKRIKRLGESSQEIGEIVQLIGDIADRTSILALNASIQAAMAGEAGRGFAVVAEEVERLAVRSADATKKIASLIRTVQSETNEAVRAMEDTTREVVAGSNVANDAGQALVQIENVSQRLTELIQSISLASKQQARGSDSVAKAMGDISETTQQTAAGTKQVAVSIANLTELADNLRESVSRFKLPRRVA